LEKYLVILLLLSVWQIRFHLKVTFKPQEKFITKNGLAENDSSFWQQRQCRADVAVHFCSLSSANLWPAGALH
jgi:hypothetical protein